MATKTKAVTDKAKRIVDAIKCDFTDRRGLRQEWDAIDAETQREIVKEWRLIVVRELLGQP